MNLTFELQFVSKRAEVMNFELVCKTQEGSVLESKSLRVMDSTEYLGAVEVVKTLNGMYNL